MQKIFISVIEVELLPYRKELFTLLTICSLYDLSVCNLSYYESTPMQYLAIFHGCKNDNFQMKKNVIFLIFAQNIDCGYTQSVF